MSLQFRQCAAVSAVVGLLLAAAAFITSFGRIEFTEPIWYHQSGTGSTSHCLQPTLEPTVGPIQDIINEFVDTLSKKNYSTFNDDISVGEMTFRALSPAWAASALTNRSLVFSGDSLINGEFKFLLCFLYDDQQLAAVAEPLSLWNPNTSFIHNCGSHVDKEAKISVARHAGETRMRHKAFATEQSQIAFVTDAVDMKKLRQTMADANAFPNVVVMDAALLHALHLIPARPFETHFDAVGMIRGFESFVSRVVDTLSDTSTKCLILRPPNPICTDKFYDLYASAAEFYEHTVSTLSDTELRENSHILRCLKSLGRDAADQVVIHDAVANVSLTGIEVCTRYIFTYRGSKTWNERMWAAVQKIQEAAHNESGLRVLFYDQFKLFSGRCRYTDDGRHYYALKGVETMALLNIIDNFC